MKKTLLLLIFFPIFLCSQSKRDLKRYNNIVKLIEQNNLDLAISKTWKLLEKKEEAKKNQDWKEFKKIRGHYQNRSQERQRKL